MNNTGNTTQLLASFNALDVAQQKVLLSSKLLTEEQKSQCATMVALSSVNSKYTAEQLIRVAGVSAETLANWGLVDSTDSLTIAELAELAVSDKQAKNVLDKIIAQNAQAVANGEVTASNIALASSEGGATLATGAFTTAIKANISAMWTWMTTTPLGWLTLLVAGVFAAVKAYDALTVSVEEQKEKMEESLSDYEDAKSELSGITTELENQEQVMNELLEKEKLTYVEKGQLEELQAITRELRIQKDLAEKEEDRTEKQLAKDATDLFDKQFGDYEISEQAINKYQSDADITGNNAILISDENDISAMIAGYKQFNELLDEAYGSGSQDDIDHFKSLTEDLEDSIFTTAQELQTQQDNISAYYESIKNTPYEDLTTEQKEIVDTYNAISNAIALIYQQLDPNTWNSMQVDNIFSTDGIEKTKDELVAMAQSGELTPETIKGYTNLNNALGETTLSAQDLCDELYAIADAQGEVQGSTSDNEITVSFNYDKLEGLESKLSSIQSAYDIITSAMQEYNEQGYLNMDTIDSLIALDDEYINALIDENGQIQYNHEAFKKLAEIKLEEAKVSLYQELCTELVRIKELDTALAAQELALANGTLTESAYETAKALYEEIYAMGNVNSELAKNAWDATERKVALLDNQLKNVTNSTYGFGKASSKSAKDTAKTFDWIETLISRIQRNITNLGKLVSATYHNWSTRNNALAQEMAEVNKEINAQMTAYNAYMGKANSIGLSDHYKNLVMNGGLKIEDIGNDALREQIESFKEYYEKALDASDAIEDLRANLADLAKTKFNNVSEQYDEQISLITHNVSMLEGFVSQSEVAGYMASEVYYKAMADKQQENIAQLQGEYSSLLSAFDEAVKSGSIEKYSEDWYNMLGSINDVELELQDATTQLIEFNQTLQQLSWGVFDRVRESVSDIVTEAEFLIDILDSKDLHTDKGVITDEGLAVQGLHAVNYNTYMEQAIAYAEEMRKIEAEMAKDPYDMELVDRRNELLELQQESIQSAMDEKSAIVDLISEGYDKMLESLQKVIDKNKEALNAEKSLFDYERDIESKTSNIASLRKQLQAYSGDNSEQAKSTIQRLQVSLNEAEKDLQQTEYEKFIDDSQQLLDSLMDDTQEWVNQRLDNIDGLISEAVDATNKNAETISSTIKETANSYGYGISDQMETIWDSANDVVCTYGDILKGTNENIANNITTGTTNVVNAINGLNGSMQTMIGKLNEIATANRDSVAQAQNAVVNGQNGSYGGNNSASDYTVSGGGDSGNTGGSGDGDKPKYEAKIGNHTVGRGYNSPEEARKAAEEEIEKRVTFAIREATKGKEKDANAIAQSIRIGMIPELTKQIKINAYASGTHNAKSGWALVGEGKDGNEIIIDKDGNAILTLAPQLLNLKGGEKIINGKETSELLTSNLMPLSSEQLWGNIIKTPKLPEMSKGVGGNVTNNNQFSFELPNVVDADSFITELQHSKRFEKIIDSMTAGKMMGKGSFDKLRF